MNSMDLRPYFIVPKLIPQPTWGGDYIAKYKDITHPSVTAMKIGQSFELFSGTMLSTVDDSRDLPIEIGDPKTGKTIDVIGDASSMFSLQSLIDQDPEAVLGKAYVEKYGPKMQILIKFTQAKGNSFQVHVRPGHSLGHWQPKPESWYFMENGKATLGLRDPSPERLHEYKKICLEIETEAKRQEARVKGKELDAETARKELAEFIKAHDPYTYVNIVDVPKGSMVDLSTGGIHHSWEEGTDIPDGNIVYEVQLNVMDDDCTLRSFDKGKIAGDGTIRPVHVEEYFSALDNDQARNSPLGLIRESNDDILFSTPYYMARLNKAQQSIDTTFGSDSFTHRFFTDDGVQKRGASLFIPAIGAVGGKYANRF